MAGQQTARGVPVLFTTRSQDCDEGRRVLQDARIPFREEACIGLINCARRPLRELPTLCDDKGNTYIGLAAVRQYALRHRHRPSRSASSGWA